MEDKQKIKPNEPQKSQIAGKSPNPKSKVEGDKPKHFPSKKEDRTPGVKRQNLPHDPIKSTTKTSKETPSEQKSTPSSRVDPK